MTQQNNPQMSARQDTITKITDSNGNTILEIGLHEYTVRHSDGSRTHRRISETFQLEDNTIWSPSMMAKVPVGICEQCRARPPFGRASHGIVSQKTAKTCKDGCGQLCCPRHIRKGRDGKWRCLSHHRQHLLKRLFHPIFFKHEED